MPERRVPTGRVSRGTRLGRLAAGQAARGVGTRLAMIGRTEQARSVLAQRSSLRAAQQIVTVLGGMKGAAMKLGQMASVLDLDLIPAEYREMFRTKLTELLDMRNLQFFSGLWKSFLPSAADSDVLDEIARNITPELDYRREARNQHRVALRYRDHPLITVPDGIGRFCTDNVLVTEFVEGRSFQRIRALPGGSRAGGTRLCEISGRAHSAEDGRTHKGAESVGVPFGFVGEQRPHRAFTRRDPQLDEGGQFALGILDAPGMQRRPQQFGAARDGQGAATAEGTGDRGVWIAVEQPPRGRPARRLVQQRAEALDEHRLVGVGRPRRQHIQHTGNQKGLLALDQRVDQLDPIGEARIDDGPGHPHVLGDRTHSHRGDAFLGRDGQRGVEDLWASALRTQMRRPFSPAHGRIATHPSTIATTNHFLHRCIKMLH